MSIVWYLFRQKQNIKEENIKNNPNSRLISSTQNCTNTEENGCERMQPTTGLSQRYLTPDDFIRLNVCGKSYEILRSTLDTFPMTLLGDEDRRREHYVDFLDACYFDLSRDIFESILYYYQSAGSLVRPRNVPMDLFVQEVYYFPFSNGEGWRLNILLVCENNPQRLLSIK